MKYAIRISNKATAFDLGRFYPVVDERDYELMLEYSPGQVLSLGMFVVGSGDFVIVETSL